MLGGAWHVTRIVFTMSKLHASTVTWMALIGAPILFLPLCWILAGRFEPVLAPAQWTSLPPDAEASASQDSGPVTERPSARSVVVADPYTIRGTLSGPDGAPFPDAWTMVITSSRGAETTRAFDAGEAEFVLDVADGRWRFSPRANGLAGHVVQIDVDRRSRKSTYLHLALEPSGVIDGTYRSPDLRPLVDFPLVLERELDHALAFTTTGSDGGFRFTDVVDGAYVIHHGDRESPAFPARHVDHRGPRQILPDVIAPKFSDLQVRVRDAEGNPVRDASVTGTGHRGGSMQGKTDSEGVYRARFLPAGIYRIVASRGDLGRSETRLTMGDDPDSIAKLSLRR